MSRQSTTLARLIGAANLAGSLITAREKEDSQLTLDRHEKEVLHEVIPADRIHRGRASGGQATHQVPVYEGLTQRGEFPIKINFPKRAPNNETRLYFKRGVFSPKPGEFWYLFRRASDDRLCIGSIPISQLAGLGTPREAIVDEDDDAYLHNGEIVGRQVKTEKGYRVARSRSKQVAERALYNSRYKCEVDSSHWTFVAERTKTPFLEPHHIVPVTAADDFPDSPLDSIQNVAALCPTCHRKVHLGLVRERLELVKAFLSSRPKLAEYLGIPELEIFAYYE